MAELAEISPPLVESVDVSDTGFHLPGQTAAHHTDPLTAPVTAGAELLTSLLSLPPRAQKRRRGERFQLDEAQLADEPTTPPAAAENTPMREADEAKQPELPMRERKFEYLDHTADIQLHSWGSTLAEAFEQQVLAMFSYMTDLAKVDVDPKATETFDVQGHDLDSLLFTLMDEFLYRFATNDWVIRDLKIESLDQTKFAIRVTGFGERFSLKKHTHGTEVKAITYSNMQIYLHGKRATSDNDEIRKRSRMMDDTSSSSNKDGDAVLAEEDDAAAAADTADDKNTHGADVYVIVDI